MQLEIKGRTMIVTREATDRKYGKRESLFMYDLKKAIAEKFKVDVVKKLAHKDGHLVDDYLYYIRQRKGDWGVFFDAHALRFCTEDFDAGAVRMRIHYFKEDGEKLQ